MQGLIAPTKNNHVLVGQSFHSVNSEDEDLKNHALQPGDFFCWKSTSERTILYNLKGKAPVKYFLYSLSTTKLQERDSMINLTHLKEVQNIHWTCISLDKI